MYWRRPAMQKTTWQSDSVSYLSIQHGAHNSSTSKQPHCILIPHRRSLIYALEVEYSCNSLSHTCMYACMYVHTVTHGYSPEKVGRLSFNKAAVTDTFTHLCTCRQTHIIVIPAVSCCVLPANTQTRGHTDTHILTHSLFVSQGFPGSFHHKKGFTSHLSVCVCARARMRVCLQCVCVWWISSVENSYNSLMSFVKCWRSLKYKWVSAHTHTHTQTLSTLHVFN